LFWLFQSSAPRFRLNLGPVTTLCKSQPPSFLISDVPPDVIFPPSLLKRTASVPLFLSPSVSTDHELRKAVTPLWPRDSSSLVFCGGDLSPKYRFLPLGPLLQRLKFVTSDPPPILVYVHTGLHSIVTVRLARSQIIVRSIISGLCLA